MSSPLSSVSVGANPLTGVKRPALGPGGVPSNQPSKRGREVAPGGNVPNVPLRAGNLPNRQTNICIPQARVMPINMLDHTSGSMLAPGDLAFVDKMPIGAIRGANYGSNIAPTEHAAQQRVYGLDAINRMLGEEEFVVGHNVLVRDEDEKGLSVNANGNVTGAVELAAVRNPKLVLPGGANPDGYKPTLRDLDQGYKFPSLLKRVAVLDRFKLEGVILSNDSYAMATHGARDTLLFNIAIQGCATINNGFNYYQEPYVPSDDVPQPRKGSRGVEVFPREKRDARLQQTHRSGTNGWTADFATNFQGIHTEYPTLMFDRQPKANDTFYLGLRAYEIPPTTRILDEKGQV